jgi:hypothetical protein
MPNDPLLVAASLLEVSRPIVQARLHKKTRNLVSARDRGNLQVVAAMQEDVVNLTELLSRIDAWLDDFGPPKEWL